MTIAPNSEKSSDRKTEKEGHPEIGDALPKNVVKYFLRWLLWFKNTLWVAPAIQGKVWIVLFGKGKRILFVLFFLLLIPVLIYFLALPDIGKLRTKNPVRTAFMEYREKEWSEKGTETPDVKGMGGPVSHLPVSSESGLDRRRRQILEA